MRHQRHQLAAVLHEVAAVRQFDRAGVDLLEPRDQRQRHRLGLRASRRGTPEARSACSAWRSRARPRRSSRPPLRRLDGAAERLRDAVRIDDHDHRAVAENGVAGKHRDVAKLARHRLDHDFLGVEHAVDHDAEGLAADLGDDDEAVSSRSTLPSSMPSSVVSRTSGNSLSRRRSTAVSLMRSMRCSDCRCGRARVRPRRAAGWRNGRRRLPRSAPRRWRASAES